MKVVECEGSPRQIGRQTGEELRDEIRTHCEMVPRRAAAAHASVAAAAFEALRRTVPDILEEIEGIAEGADLQVEEIRRINVPINDEELTAVDETCSNVAFAAGPDGSLLGKNNDGLDTPRPIYAKKMRRSGGIPVVVFPFAGWVGTASGMNAEGLCIGSSSVGSVFQRTNRHVPLRFWSYLVMQRSRTTEEYVEAMSERPLRGKGFSLLCADRNGIAVSLEAPSPLIQVRRSVGASMINCVNRYQIPALADADRRTPEGKANADARIRFFEEEAGRGGSFDLGRMKRILRHHGSPSVCRHGDEQDPGMTEYSYICVPAQGRVLCLNGRPCENEYVSISV